MYSLEHRPFDYDGVVGQRIITSELKNRSKDLRYPQVMLFEGQSGTGKTTTAMITAAILQCKAPVERDNALYPCGECPSCLDIRGSKFNRDTMFFNAGNTSSPKDDVLRIQKYASIMPMQDSKKVIIIDEAQELSKAGKGALMGLLEKPYKNVYFILCTMDISSFDKAIISRSQVYKFRPIRSNEIAQYLGYVLKKEELFDTVPEGFLITEDDSVPGIFTIAEYAQGNLRNALQNLERCIYAELWDTESIRKEFGFIDESSLSQAVLKMLKRDASVLKDVTTDTKEFFYGSLKILSEALIYKASGYVREEWKRKYYEPLSKYDSTKLLEVYESTMIACPNYLNQSVFLAKLSQYFAAAKKEDEVPVVQREGAPVRRRAKRRE